MRRGGEEGLLSRRRSVRDAKPEGQEEIGGEGGSCTERRGVVISMTGGVEGAERKEIGGFSFLFFYIIYSLLRYKKSHGALAMAKTKPKIQKVLTKETSGTYNYSTGVRTGPRPTYAPEI